MVVCFMSAAYANGQPTSATEKVKKASRLNPAKAQ